MNIKLEGKHYSITIEPLIAEEKWKVPDEINDEISELSQQAKRGKKSVKVSIEKLIAAYPAVPVLRNILQVYYRVTGDSDMAYQVNDEILKLFPGYLFAITTKAGQLLKTGKLEEAKALLGEKMDIGALYPHRTIFHLSEYRAYTAEAVEYLARARRYDEAIAQIELLKQVDTDDDLTIVLEKKVGLLLVEKGLKGIYEERESAIRAVNREDFTVPQQHFLLHCSSADFKFLYLKQWDVDLILLKEKIDTFPEHLTAELCYIINRAITGHEYMEQEKFWNAGVLHALLIFPHIDDELGLTYLLKLLRQPDRCWQYWVAGWEKQILPQYFRKFSERKLQLLDDFFKERNGNTRGKITLICYLSFFVEQSQEPKERVIIFLGNLFKYLLANRDDTGLFDSDFATFLVGAALDLRATDLLEIIGEFYEQGWIATGLFGNFNEVKHDMLKPSKAHTSVFHKDVFEHFASIKKEMDELKKMDEHLQKSSTRDSIKRNASHNKNIFAGVSRNSFCPCGSGKKYKRCHGQ